MDKKNIVVFILTFVLCLSIFSTNNLVYSEKITQDVFKLKESLNIIVNVMWENEQPDVKLISPKGEIFNLTDNYNSDIKHIRYNINNAVAGQWGVEYDKKDNEYINVFHEENKFAVEVDQVDQEIKDIKRSKTIFTIMGLTAITTISIFAIIMISIIYYNKVKKYSK